MLLTRIQRRTLKRIPLIILLMEEEEEESSEDDDDEEEEASKEDEDEEEDHLAPTDFSTATPPRSPRTKVPFSQTRLRRARKTVRHQPPMAASTKALIAEFAFAPTPPSPPPSPLSPSSSPLPHIPSPPLLRAVMIQSRATSPPPVPSPPLLLPSADHRSDIPEMDMPFRKMLCLTTLEFRFEVGESLTVAAARQTGQTLAHRVDYGFVDTVDASIRASESRVMTAVEEDAQEDCDALRAQISLLTRERRYFFSMAYSYEREAIIARQAWSRSEDRSMALEASIRTLEAQVRTLQTQHDRMECRDSRQKIPPKKTTTPMTDAAIKQLIAQGVADALGTEGVVSLTQWFEKMESVFHISNYIVAGQIKFVTCTLLGSALTWWNSHVNTIGHDTAYGMP
ncbi:hypothetical protein Tco_1263218 [Tanacetum coccineum]